MVVWYDTWCWCEWVALPLKWYLCISNGSALYRICIHYFGYPGWRHSPWALGTSHAPGMWDFLEAKPSPGVFCILQYDICILFPDPLSVSHFSLYTWSCPPTFYVPLLTPSYVLTVQCHWNIPPQGIVNRLALCKQIILLLFSYKAF